MTKQNQDYAPVAASLPAELQVTHRFIHDGGVQGFRHATLPLAGVAYYPQLTPGQQKRPGIGKLAGRRGGESMKQAKKVL